MTLNQRISIITPVFNAQESIEACLLSVAGQSYQNIEHIILDGASTDGTLDLIKKCADQYPHIHWVSEKDEGVYDAMNKGLDFVHGEWVYFIGADDTLFDQDVLKRIFLETDMSGFDLVYGNVSWGGKGETYDGEFSLSKLLAKNICHQAIFTRKAVFDRLGGFNLAYRVLADWEFNIRCFANAEIKKKYLPVTVARYGAAGFSTRNDDAVFYDEMENMIGRFFPKEHAGAYVELMRTRHQLSELQWLKNSRKGKFIMGMATPVERALKWLRNIKLVPGDK